MFTVKWPRRQISDYYATVTPAMVASSLGKERADSFDLLNFLSPAAAAYRSAMRGKATLFRRRYYGRTVSVYAPLYISNRCVNACQYCDFNGRRNFSRKFLSLDEVVQEGMAIRQSGIDSLLIVAGEDPKRITVEYLGEVARVLKPYFSYLALEVAPQNENGYQELFRAGFEGVTCFQETYNRTLYQELHPSGPKSDYAYRLGTPLRAGSGRFRTLGIAFLLGLDDWRIEAVHLAAHARFLMKECHQSKIQFAFPRITPVSGRFQPAYPVEEAELEQLMAAFRIVFPECGMTISTREAPAFRDAMVVCSADNMSAGSKVTPGGYAVNADQDVGQFSLNDSRPAEEVFRAIRKNGQEIIFKNWDNRIG